MATKSIAWNDGSGDHIQLTYSGSGNGSIVVESDPNNQSTSRSKSITVETVGGAVVKNLTISQTACPVPVGTVLSYDYTGTVQSVLLPSGTYKLQCWGAQGGSVSGSYTATGAKGGYSEGTLTLSSPTTLYIFVGGQGSSSSTSTTSGAASGGWNGGGGATRYSSYNSGGTNGISYPRPGGGATDISTVTSDMSYSSYRNNRSAASLNARLIVAGGGAGASARYTSSTSSTSVSGTVTSGYYVGAIGTAKGTSQIIENSFSYYGSIIDNSKLCIKVYAVQGGKKYFFSGFFTANTQIDHLEWYDSSNNYISSSGYAGPNTDYTRQEVTAPSNAAYAYMNAYSDSMSYFQLYCAPKINDFGLCPHSNFKSYRFPVTAGNTYNVYCPSISASSDYTPIFWGNGYDNSYEFTLINDCSAYTSSTISGYNGTITIPSGISYMFITVNVSSSTPTVSHTTTSTSYDTSSGTQVGGGTSGGGTNPGTQSGGGGELGKGANMTATNYRYCSGGGGGGYYGGGSSYDDSTTNKINQSGGGSGYVGSLSSAQTKAGNTSFPKATGSGNETGHSGDGYAKITRLS